MIEIEWGVLGNDFGRREAALTIGVFDGLHLGHRALIDPVVQSTGLSVVVTFERHPSEMLLHDRVPGYLMSLAQRREELSRIGVDVAVLVDFTAEIRDLPGKVFLEQLLQRFSVTRMVVGYDFGIGRNRDLRFPQLSGVLARHRIDLVQADAVLDDGLPVSSTRIRGSILEGRLDEASRLLGRPYTLDVEGEEPIESEEDMVVALTDRRILPESLQILPPPGRYAARFVGDDGARCESTLVIRENSLGWPLAAGKSIRYIVLNQNRNVIKE
jgi:riboflavin kinase/FMN adenylyltransferase